MTVSRLALAHLLFTAGMAGVISVVQFVVYPQYALVPADVFSEYVASHGMRIGVPLVLFAPAEVLLALFLWLRMPGGSDKNLAFVAGALLAVIWVSTIVWFGPMHGRLIGGYDADNIRLLADTNWLRTLLWWVRTALALWLADRAINTGSINPAN